MVRINAFFRNAVAASLLILWSAQTFSAGEFSPSPLRGRANFTPDKKILPPPQAQPVQEKWPALFDIKGAQHAVFNFTLSTPGKIIVSVQSQGDPVVRFLVKPSGEPLFINSAAPFEYAVTAEDISKGPQWKVDIYLPPQKTAQGNAAINPNWHANGSINIQHPPADIKNAQAAPGMPAITGTPGSAAARATEQPLTEAPAAFSSILMLPRRQGAVELTPKPVDINSRFVSAQRSPIQHQPFKLEEVFDIQTGKPIFSVNELNGELQLPHAPKVSVSHAVQSDIEVLRYRGVNTFTFARGGVFRLKTESGRQVVTIPRKDGNAITVPAEVFLREVNAYERSLNTHGITMRDSQTGKISATPRTITVSKLSVNVSLLKQQYLDNDRKLIKGVTVKPWDSTDIFSRHKNALDHIPPARLGSNNRLISALLPAGVKLGKSRFANMANAAARTQDVTRVANSAITDKLQKCALVQGASNQPDGGVSGDVVTINIAKYDANACIVSFEDGAGKMVDMAVTQVSPTQLKVTVPSGLKNGTGSIVLRAKTTPYRDSAPFYLGSACSIESVYPQRGMADIELVLKVGRFKNCDLMFTDLTSAHSPVAYTVVDDQTIKTKVPGFTIGNDKIEAAKHRDSTGNQQPVSSSLAFSILRTVVDQNGNAPPPDYFSQGIKPFKRIYEWDQPYGDPSSFAVDVFANSSIFSDGSAGDNKVMFQAKGGAKGTLFNNTAEIISASADAGIPTATSNDSKMRVNFRMQAGGQTFYTWKKNQDKDNGTSEASQNSCEENQKVGGKCCDDIKPDKTCGDDGFALQVQIKYDHDYQMPPVDYAVSTNFAIGPVPMVARFGFHGDAGTRVRFALSPLQAIGQIKPYVHTAVYGECGAEAVFVTVGVGVDMVLANMELDAVGMAYLDFGQMALATSMYVNLDYDFLDGNVYAFADAFGGRVKYDIFNINEIASQATGMNLVFKGHSYLLAPQTLTYPLLGGGV